MAHEITRAPVLRGVTQVGIRRDPFDNFMEALVAQPDRSGVAQDKVVEAINLLLQAGDEDPAIRPILGPALKFLTEGPSRPPASRRDTGFRSPVERRR